ncbi:hypothetical protein L227DRAFT_355484 [Lentinus tigrinus ALCF2SS1-6]|uniref:Protein kinase domain-containing protein n=1 Tax=Lentinus tigrinus ALCF2SS1-6 TaxID=1328759 RepID=A0A5C2RRQ4_9APHY|nr:hypothetical protein L227DRAFT_355484 [Lentinus tigrinus ALCF2SS1-6]
MSHSHLSFAGDRLPYSLNASHLTSAFPSTYPFNVFAAGLTELLQETDDVDVFRSVITTLEDSSFRFLAVCKVAYGFEEVEALEREVGFYQRELRHLQGKYIPRLFGYFVGTTVRGTTAALVTSDEGRPLLKPFACLSLQFRKRVYRGLRRIHQAGVHHGDVLEANLVVRRRKDGSYWPMIVDFDRARKHECEVKGKKTQIYGPCPEPGEDVCFELYAIGGEEGLDIWRPNSRVRGFVDSRGGGDGRELRAGECGGAGNYIG